MNGGRNIHISALSSREDLKKTMREEFVPHEYELILLRRLKRIKQGSKSVQSYHDELSFAMHQTNIVDDMDAKEYLMRGLNANIAAAIKRKVARSVHNLLAYALKEKLKSCSKIIFQSALICAKTLPQGYMLS
jgi:hypothetical protein